ncbi:MAG: RnfABCDGE type electron transport complex subunit D [Clostridia bacterium]|nr:RnfABCDGE type electron transport complex subunit D [Clostridia bacterium]
MEQTLLVSSSPHVHCGMNTRDVMRDVIIALIPALLASIWLFGFRALAVEVVCVAAAIAAEYLSRRVMKRAQTVGDLSAVVTGLLLAFNLPSTIPLWQAAFGSVVAIVVAKQMFGGLGQNFVNPALVGRIVLMGSFPGEMNNWEAPFAWLGKTDVVSSATPLAEGAEIPPLTDLLFGLRGGSLGETCVIALLIGGLYLVIRRVISPMIPVVYIGTVFVLTLLLGNVGAETWSLYTQAPAAVLSGGLMLGAVFMATDYATCPINRTGKLVYAIGCGVITVLIRLFGSLPEGVSFAIVIMNILVPLIERVTRPRPFGEQRKKVEK